MRPLRPPYCAYQSFGPLPKHFVGPEVGKRHGDAVLKGLVWFQQPEEVFRVANDVVGIGAEAGLWCRRITNVRIPRDGFPKPDDEVVNLTAASFSASVWR